MPEKLVNFRFDEEKYKKLKMQALKEDVTVKRLIEIQIDDYLKKHLDGNPQFTIEQFNDPNFIACPAFYRDGKTWENYIKKSNDKERQKLKDQIILLDKKLSMYI